MIWAIIPARAGSQGLKEKNTALLGGKPLYRWVLDAAIESGIFDKIVISTDIEQIFTERFGYGDGRLFEPRSFKVHLHPPYPPEGLPMGDLVHYILSQFDEKPEYFALLQPTSPFIRAEDIRFGYEWLPNRPDANSFQTTKRVKHLDHAYNQRVMKGEFVNFVFPWCRKDVRRQSQPKHYAWGNLIITRTKYFLKTGDFFGKSLGLPIPWKNCIDIDDESDLALAELLI